MTQNLNDQEPWYAPSGQKERPLLAGLGGRHDRPQDKGTATGATDAKEGPTLSSALTGAAALLLALLGGIFLDRVLVARGDLDTGRTVVLLGLALLTLVVAFFLMLRQIGVVLASASPKLGKTSAFQLSIDFLKGQVKIDDARRFVPAPEMALQQFVMQVRAYATEKSFQKNRLAERAGEVGGAASKAGTPEPVDLLKRRWNEVIDSLNEFEIYLANDPRGMIEKFLAKYPMQTLDVSQIFRDVAESFDTTWRRKGINIESAIVTPLKTTTNEALMRRLLVGPWRASAYLTRRGNNLLFTAKSVDGHVVARWESEATSIPEDFLVLAQQTEIPINERIERGMLVIAGDPNSPNTLHALVSFLTWIDIAKLSETNFSFKNANDGFVIEMKFR